MCPVIYISGFPLPVFSVFSLLAALICFLYYCLNSKYSKLLYRDLMVRLGVMMTGCAVGGKLLPLVLRWKEWPGSFITKVMHCGFVFYGAFIGGFLGLWIVCGIISRKNRYAEPFLYWTDLITSLLPLGQSIGRIGCFFNGCCYGRHWSRFPGMLYPFRNEGGLLLYDRVFPTWFAESIFCLCLFFVLQQKWRKDRKYYSPGMTCGQITTVYCMAYADFRFFLEFMRGDEIRGVYMGWLSTSQIISILIILICIAAALKKEIISVQEKQKKKGGRTWKAERYFQIFSERH